MYEKEVVASKLGEKRCSNQDETRIYVIISHQDMTIKAHSITPKKLGSIDDERQIAGNP